jgi:hypothetical protein
MKTGEREELQRQGAKAAARGESELKNPMLAPCNTPPRTGESAELWHERVESWQSGFDSQQHTARTTPDSSDR